MDNLRTYQFYSKFSRWIPELGRRETWEECVEYRVIPWLRNLAEKHGARLEETTWQWLADMVREQKASPALRVIQMAGKALDRCQVGVYNCSYLPISDLGAFAEILYICMQGTGVGFSVEWDHISRLPKVSAIRKLGRERIVVEDSTEGWCEALDRYIRLLWDGYEVDVDVSRVRPRGSPLRTKGGYASGPEPLVELCRFIRNVIEANRGKRLKDTDVHRIATFIGKIVQVGGVRRSAMLSLSDLKSEGMRVIKSGEFWNDKTYWGDGLYLTMANNSAVYYDYVDEQTFWQEWESLARSGTGERGVFNRSATWRWRPRRRELAQFGTNPCGEIVLRPYEFCNLSIAVARPEDTEETLAEKVKAATYFGVLQSLATDFRYIRSDWARNCKEERLLGVDITGHVDCPLLRRNTPERNALLVRLKGMATSTAESLARQWGIAMPAAITTVKPSGDSAVLFGCSSGVHPRYAKYYIRWVRESKESPVAKFLAASGVPNHPAPEAPDRLMVFGFPVKSPEDALTRNDLTAVEQLENWLAWRENYVEHSVSATVYVDHHEWTEVGKWVWEHLDAITGISFLPKDNGVYRYAPHEEISEEEYASLVQQFPEIDWSRLAEYDQGHYFDRGHFVCSAGSCTF